MVTKQPGLGERVLSFSIFRQLCQGVLFWFFLSALVAAGSELPETVGLGSSQSGGAIGLDNVGYLSKSHIEEPNSQLSSFFLAHWRGERHGSVWEGVVQGELFLTVNNNAYRNGELSELYFGTVPNLQGVQVSLGRKKEIWSHLDEQWKLGIWQPRFRWDFLNPESVGLTGAFVTVDRPGFKFVGLVSPIMIPERGMPVEYQNGAFHSKSPWAQAPPSETTLFDTQTPISYSVDVPPISRMILHPGAAVLARVGEQEGWWGSAALAYKPMNQLIASLSPMVDISNLNSVAVADVAIYPQVVYHELASAEVGYSTGVVDSCFSAMVEHPIRNSPPSPWLNQELTDALTMGPSLGLHLSPFGKNSTLMTLGYLAEWGGDAPDSGFFGNTGSRSFEARYPYQQAFMAGGKTNFSGAIGSRITASAQFLYDLGHQGTILSTDFKYQSSRNWAMFVGADILGSDRPDSDLKQGVDFISQHRANDRVEGGVTYAF